MCDKTKVLAQHFAPISRSEGYWFVFLFSLFNPTIFHIAIPTWINNCLVLLVSVFPSWNKNWLWSFFSSFELKPNYFDFKSIPWLFTLFRCQTFDMKYVHLFIISLLSVAPSCYWKCKSSTAMYLDATSITAN